MSLKSLFFVITLSFSSYSFASFSFSQYPILNASTYVDGSTFDTVATYAPHAMKTGQKFCEGLDAYTCAGSLAIGSNLFTMANQWNESSFNEFLKDPKEKAFTFTSDLPSVLLALKIASSVLLFYKGNPQFRLWKLSLFYYGFKDASKFERAYTLVTEELEPLSDKDDSSSGVVGDSFQTELGSNEELSYLILRDKLFIFLPALESLFKMINSFSGTLIIDGVYFGDTFYLIYSYWNLEEDRKVLDCFDSSCFLLDKSYLVLVVAARLVLGAHWKWNNKPDLKPYFYSAIALELAYPLLKAFGSYYWSFYEEFFFEAPSNQ